MTSFRRSPILCILISALVLAACDRQIPQLVAGRFEPSFGQPPAVVALFEGEACTGPSIRSHVSPAGEFSFRLSSTRGGVGVVTQQLSLCGITAAGQVQPIWSSLHGGGATAIKLSCRRPAGDEGFCGSSFTYRDEA